MDHPKSTPASPSSPPPYTNRNHWYGQLDRPRLLEMVAPPPDPDPPAWSKLAEALISRLGPDRVRTDPATLMAYSYDATGERRSPHLVVLPDRPEDVGLALREADAIGAPVVVRGAGSNLSGGTMPLFGGLVLALARLTAPIQLDATHLAVRAQVGWVNAALNAALAFAHLFFPADPSSHRIATIGGNVQENSGGPHAYQYGVTEHHVLEMSGWLVDGTPLHLRRPTLPGNFDVLGLVVGSEGTLVAASEVMLALARRPAGTTTALVAFRTVRAACRAVADIVAAHIEPAALELLDRPTVELVERFAGAGYPLEAGAVLLIDLDGSEPARQQACQALNQVTDTPDRLTFHTTSQADEADRLWLGRRAAYGALARVSAHVFVQDVTVPRPELADMMDEVLAIAKRYQLTVLTVAHAGDGNLHPTLAYNPADPDEMRRLFAADTEILTAAARRDGSITGEHGVGIDKLEHLALMYNEDERRCMADLKRVFDPHGRLNPGKAIWTRTEPAPGRPRRPADPAGLFWDVLEEARREQQTVRIVGAERRWPAPAEGLTFASASLDAWHDLNRDNLTATVGAGMRVAELDQALSRLGLEWAVDPLAPDETVGGVVAGALPSLREAGVGPVRSQVLGVTAIDGAGRCLRFGRPVLKNVAGYDVSKLWVGSFGRLGLITALTLRLRPRLPLVWRRLPAGPDHLVDGAWQLLGRSNRPTAVLGQPGYLTTAWPEASDPGVGWGEAIADPRSALGQQLAALIAGGGSFGEVGRAGAPPPDPAQWQLWWPLTGVIAMAPGAPPPVSRPADPVGEQLISGIRSVFDPDHLLPGPKWLQPVTDSTPSRLAAAERLKRSSST